MRSCTGKLVYGIGFRNFQIRLVLHTQNNKCMPRRSITLSHKCYIFGEAMLACARWTIVQEHSDSGVAILSLVSSQLRLL